MVTYRQLVRGFRVRRKRKAKKRTFSLQGCPQKRGTCTKVHIMTPRKPCSARRAMARVKLSNLKMVTCHIPGVGHNIKKFSSVLVKGGRPNDMPGVQYKIIRGGKKSDLEPMYILRSRRSKFGVKNIMRPKIVRSKRAKNIAD